MTIDEIIKELEEGKDYPASDPPSEEVLDTVISILKQLKGHKTLIDLEEVIEIANKTKDLHGAIWKASRVIIEEGK